MFMQCKGRLFKSASGQKFLIFWDKRIRVMFWSTLLLCSGLKMSWTFSKIYGDIQGRKGAFRLAAPILSRCVPGMFRSIEKAWRTNVKFHAPLVRFDNTTRHMLLRIFVMFGDLCVSPYFRGLLWRRYNKFTFSLKVAKQLPRIALRSVKYFRLLGINIVKLKAHKTI